MLQIQMPPSVRQAVPDALDPLGPRQPAGIAAVLHHAALGDKSRPHDITSFYLTISISSD